MTMNKFKCMEDLTHDACMHLKLDEACEFRAIMCPKKCLFDKERDIRCRLMDEENRFV